MTTQSCTISIVSNSSTAMKVYVGIILFSYVDIGCAIGFCIRKIVFVVSIELVAVCQSIVKATVVV